MSDQVHSRRKKATGDKAAPLPVNNTDVNVANATNVKDKNTVVEGGETNNKQHEPMSRPGASYLITYANMVEGGVHFLAFIHKVGARADEIDIHAVAKNNIPEYVESIQGGFVRGCKVHAVVACKKGDADKMLTFFDESNSGAKKKNSHWYKLSKNVVDDFVKSLINDPNYVLCTEKKAVVKAKPVRKPKAESIA